jgi:hypothetical protein
MVTSRTEGSPKNARLGQDNGPLGRLLHVGDAEMRPPTAIFEIRLMSGATELGIGIQCSTSTQLLATYVLPRAKQPK